MPCGCNPIVTPPVNPCAGCLVVNNVTIACSDGPDPCGGANGTGQIDLGALNDLTVCSGIPVWSIKSYDSNAFTSVTITPAGILDFVTANWYENGKEYEIVYEVDCPEQVHRAEGIVKICFNNPCGPICKECNPCNGNCLYANDGATNATITPETCPAVGNVFDLKTISSYTDCGTNITYDLVYPTTIFANVSEALGVISFEVLPAAVSGATYNIVYTMTCLDFGIQKTGTLTVTTTTLCHGVVCGAFEACDPCTGICNVIPDEISITP